MVRSREVHSIYKEASRLLWIVKGRLIPEGYSDEDIREMHDSYMLRLWPNHEANIHTDGFEEAYKEKYG